MCTKCLHDELTIKIKDVYKKNVIKLTLINIVIVLIFLFKDEFSIETISNILLCQILIYASVWDIVTHTVPNYIHILIAGVGLIGFDFLPALLGFIVVGLPLFIAAIIKENMIGGGDVKFMAAIGFCIGVNKGFTTLILGLFLAVIFSRYFNKVKDMKKEQVALIPYFSMGCALALL